MSAHPQFDNASPALPADFPIVLRFESLHPNDLGRFKMHDQRQGGDLSHVDPVKKLLNEVLYAQPKWDAQIKSEVEQAKARNMAENIRALEEKSRIKEAKQVKEAGFVDPWKRCQIGPLREGILTVNKAWFGGTGHDAWNTDRVSSFKSRAMDFLNEHFPDGQLRFASAHADEEAFHIHFVVAVWAERVTVNRGSQILLQASKNPLLSNYEYAQTLAGEAFAPLGLTRGEERAKAIREAKARGEVPPERRRHVAPSEWRAEQIKQADAIKQAAEQEAKTMIAAGRTLGTATVRKSRKRAIKEAQATKAAAAKDVLAAERQKQAEEQAAMAARQAADAARQDQAEAQAAVIQLTQQAGEVTQAAEAALERARLTKQAVAADVSALHAQKVGLVAEVRDIAAEKEQVQEAVTTAQTHLAEVKVEVLEVSAKRVEVEKAAAAAHQDLTNARAEMAVVSAERVQVEAVVKAALSDLTEVKAEVAVISQQKEAVARELTGLEALIAAAKRELSEVKGRVEATFKGLKLLAGQVIGWGKLDPDAAPSLTWGVNAPPDPATRKALIRSIKPGIEEFMPLAAAIVEATAAVTQQARRELAEEAAFLSDLRTDWTEAQKTRLETLRRQGDGSDPSLS